MLAGLVIINVHRDLHLAVGGVIVVAPHAGGILFLKGKCVIAQNLLMLIGGVHIKQEHAAFFHKKTRIGNGGIQIRDVVEGVKGGYRCPDGAVEIQLEQVLPQQQQPTGKPQLLGFIPHHAEHLLRLVDADHIVTRLCQHQGQFPGAAAKVGYNAIVDAVGFQLCMDLAVQGVVVCLAVEFIVKIGKFVVSHGVTPLPHFPQPLRR